MKRGTRVRARAGVALVTGVLSLALAGGVQAASLSAAALHKSDVPAGFSQTSATARSAQQAASADGVSLKTLRAHGWAGQYETTFVKSTKAGATEIDSGVTQYRTASGATWDFTNALHVFKKQLPSGREFSIGGIGEKAIGIRGTTKVSGLTAIYLIVVFLKGGYEGGAAITAAGKVAAPSLSAAEKYARVIASRV